MCAATHCAARRRTPRRTWSRRPSWSPGAASRTFPRTPCLGCSGWLANQRRSAGRSAALTDRLGATAADAGSHEEGVGEADALRSALARLSEQDREALMLVAWHGLSGARAARAAGCSRSAFGVRLHRARRRLAAQLRTDQNPIPANATPMETR